MLPSLPSSKPAVSAQFLTSAVLACHREPVHGKFGEYGARELVCGLAGPLAFQRPHGLGEFFQAEDTDRVVEQA